MVSDTDFSKTKPAEKTKVIRKRKNSQEVRSSAAKNVPVTTIVLSKLSQSKSIHKIEESKIAADNEDFDMISKEAPALPKRSKSKSNFKKASTSSLL